MSTYFDQILEKALSEWPEIVELNPLGLNFHPKGLFHSVDGLGDFRDDLCEKYFNTDEEVFMRRLHDSIYIALHRMELNVDRIWLRDLRREGIRQTFESSLNDLRTEDGWREQDFLWRSKYFESMKAYPNPLDG
jgi:hypothetical protein